ncbi:Hypothetical protein R9X50_00448100 [Acrodontium crateriforme]|uniref:Dynamin GTPase n=1 Tax=Acrodontium crateriforme TaxID=150365 RepID=A0AAQ3M822_9PEZI|nr:Hypothetical protein R9X50_00448100 [Acrodontium crateriforme]
MPSASSFVSISPLSHFYLLEVVRSFLSLQLDERTLNKIDQLFSVGIGDHIHLPQLVVVGDQSSGKSSVLEGLTRLPFPRDSGLCTRFATQITFRRAPQSAISVSIIPAKSTSAEDADRLRAWQKKDLKELDIKSFSDIMREVNAVMKLKNSDGEGGSETFSQNVLKLDVSGPDQEHFSIVDVPGIFRVATEGITTDADKDMVREMVQSYMRNQRSVMLAVIPANVDVATQEILTLAKEHDPDGRRTIGVLTKPDLVDQGAEQGVMDLVNGLKHKLRLGWSIVRNLSQNQLQSQAAQRAALEEKFFANTEPWNRLHRDRVGILSLKSRLAEILASLIRHEFPKVKLEINKQLNEAKQEALKLGPSRVTAFEQQKYLLTLSTEFQKIVATALRADYYANAWFSNSKERRIATFAVDLNERFGKDMHALGHLYSFASPEERQTDEDDTEYPEDWELSSDDSDGISFKIDKNEPDLTVLDYGTDPTYFKYPKDGILAWISNIHRKSRGFELGTFNTNLLAAAMNAQSRNWRALALNYISILITKSHGFVKSLLTEICPDDSVRDALLSALMDDLLEIYQNAINHVNFLLRIERSGVPATLNHYFNENLQKSRQDRVRSSLEEHSFECNELDGKKSKAIRVQDVKQTSNMSNSEHVVLEIHDILEAYYKVALKRFTDNVAMQAADNFLINGPVTPLKLFSPAFVAALSEEQLAAICEEDNGLKRKRNNLEKKIQDLQMAKKIIA